MLGGVPAERVTTPGSDGVRQVLYLHGGGYKTGSPASHRSLTAHLSRACGAAVHVPDYRLAPEHPFPAAVDDAVAAWRALRAAGRPRASPAAACEAEESVLASGVWACTVANTLAVMSANWCGPLVGGATSGRR